VLENDKMTKDYKHLLSSGPCEFWKSLEEWNFENGLLLHCGKVYIPKDQQLHLDLLKLHHNTLLAGHPGCWKTLELLACNYWWPGMSVDVKKYVQSCNTCCQCTRLCTGSGSVLDCHGLHALPAKWAVAPSCLLVYMLCSSCTT
jgi:hypothetical protein